jgi:hypothetical protein
MSMQHEHKNEHVHGYGHHHNKGNGPSFDKIIAKLKVTDLILKNSRLREKQWT